MKAIKLNYEDSCIFGTKVTLSKCDFLKNNMDSFMSMYKNQGSTFWLRFLMSFKSYLERKFASNTTQLTALLNHLQFIKVLHYVFINIHKKLIEASNTSVKKFVNNLVVLGVNSPEYMELEPKYWLKFLKSSKHLQNVLNNLLGLPDPSDYNEFIVLLYTMYADFVSSLCSLFEHWYFACDLTEEELKTIDSKIIYWLPNFDLQNKKIKALCFEKYLSDYWKNELQRMLLTEDIHENFGIHKKKDCCDYFEKEKNIFHIFSFTGKNASSLMKMMCNEDSEEEIETITEVTLKDLCVLQPRMEMCSKHKKCFLKISHDAICTEPFICNGSSPCTITCEYNLKQQDKENTTKNFWKNMSAEEFNVTKKTRDVSTLAESSEIIFETYLHFPLSMLKYSYTQCLSELYNFDFDPRKTEAVNRLRKKLRDKHNSSLLPVCKEDFKESFFRINLMEIADAKMMELETKYCTSKQVHNFGNGSVCNCFVQFVNSIGSNSADVFGRVVYLAKTSFSVPVMTVNDVAKHRNNKKSDIQSKSDPKNCPRSDLPPETKKKKSKSNAEIISENLTEEICKKSVKVSKSDDLLLASSTDSFQINIKACKSYGFNSTVSPINPRVKIISISSKCDDFIPAIATIGTSKKNENVSKSDDVTHAVAESVKDIEIPKSAECENAKSNVDEEVDEILKLIGIREINAPYTNHEDSFTKPKEETIMHNSDDSNFNEDKAVENFFNLIGQKDSPMSAESSLTELKTVVEKGDKKAVKLRICAYCHKKETERKTFKRCSKCKEENFLVHRYYCSRECLIEDWTESHQDEHLQKKKISS